jgi:REP element-mobilizing transposase RayT
MEKEKKFDVRKPNRLKKYDYNSTGAYFLTICTSDRQKVLSEIVGDDVLGVPEKQTKDHGNVEPVGTTVSSADSVTSGSESPPDSHSIPSVSLRYLGVPKNPKEDNATHTIIVPRGVLLLPYGKTAEKYIKQLSNFYENLQVDCYVIMPNHIHILLQVKNNKSQSIGAKEQSLNNSMSVSQIDTRNNSQDIILSPPRQTATISHFVSTFKRFCNREYGANIWQRGFYDHIIRCPEDYDEVMQYIYENPMKWQYDELH